MHSAFERLLKDKQYEALLQLGPTLAKGSQHHIETSSDDFEPHYSISECIGCVMQALTHLAEGLFHISRRLLR